MNGAVAEKEIEVLQDVLNTVGYPTTTTHWELMRFEIGAEVYQRRHLNWKRLSQDKIS